jgi:hypothetical protein
MVLKELPALSAAESIEFLSLSNRITAAMAGYFALCPDNPPMTGLASDR